MNQFLTLQFDQFLKAILLRTGHELSVLSTGGPITINRNQFDVNVYLIPVFYFMSAFKNEIVKVK